MGECHLIVRQTMRDKKRLFVIAFVFILTMVYGLPWIKAIRAQCHLASGELNRRLLRCINPVTVGNHNDYLALENRRNVTIVSAYFDLGSFQKGPFTFKTQGKTMYQQWAKALGKIDEPLVFFTDSLEFQNLILHIRRFQENITSVFLVHNRSHLWSFQLKGAIKKIFTSPGYPQFQPNTVLPEYSCVQHVKYDLIELAINKDLYNTDYYVWMDVGYFRDIIDINTRFSITIPCDFHPSKVGFNLVDADKSLSISPSEIIRGNEVWVGGGFFFGRKKVLIDFCKQYRNAVKMLLRQNLMNTDQQVLFALFSNAGRMTFKPETEIQTYRPQYTFNNWFYLGYLCLEVKLKAEK